MTNPNIKTKVKHSKTKHAWNVIGDMIGEKYKIARVPYVISGNTELDAKSKHEAYIHAKFISDCFNNSKAICALLNSDIKVI